MWEKNPDRSYISADLEHSKVWIREAKSQTPSNVVFTGTHALESIQRLIGLGYRVRHINIDYPYPGPVVDKIKNTDNYFEKVVELAPQFLLPNGKIFVTSESLDMLRQLSMIAKYHGFSVKKIVTKTLSEAKNRTFHSENLVHHPMYRLEVTFPLKKAFPKKEDRRLRAGK